MAKRKRLNGKVILKPWHKDTSNVNQTTNKSKSDKAKDILNDIFGN